MTRLIIRNGGAMDSTWVAGGFALFGAVVGALAGGAATYLAARQLDQVRREQEYKDIAVGLYHEVADRAARCLNDYIEPWESYRQSASLDLSMTGARVGKFRPTEPVVYPLIAAKLGVVRSHVLGPTLQFYFALDALQREIDGITADFAGNDMGPRAVKPPGRLQLVAKRFRGTLAPALRTLEALGVDGWAQIDQRAIDIYPHVKDNYASLRDGLRDKGKPE